MRTRGFTLIEIMVVVVIIGLLATLAGRHVVQAGREGERRIALAKCKEYHDAVMMWRMFGGTRRKPTSLNELEAPLSDGEPNFLRVEHDPWGGPFRLDWNNGDLHVCSSGPDGAEGTNDDICYVPREH